MSVPRRTIVLVLVASAAACASRPATEASAPAPAASASATGALTAPDFTGDWEFTAQLRDGSLTGTWRLTHTEAGYSGVVASSLGSPVPIRSFTARGRSFTLTFEFANDTYTINGTAESPQTVTGTLSFRGGMGRLSARKR